MSLIKKVLPQTRYEKEALIKSFLLFFTSIELLLLTTTYLYYKNQEIQLKNQIFLELKNYSYVLKGREFPVDIEEKKEGIQFYQLYSDRETLYIYAPIPFVENEVLKISYPKEKYRQQLNQIKKQIGVFLLFITPVVALMSVVFSLYSLYPIRKAITMMNEFIRDIVHDINTPISSILLNLKILKIKHKNDEEVERIESAVKRLQNIYENLYTLDREIEKNIKEVPVKKVIMDELNALEQAYPDIKIILNLKDVHLKTDENALRRIVMNILSNAFKHNIKNGWIDIYLTEKYLKVVNSSRPVKDSSKLFDRYYKESQRGIGLGLAIVKQLADELGYRVKIHTEKNRFSITVNFS
ncbi:sensor histidine kinase [Persephonella sp.]